MVLAHGAQLSAPEPLDSVAHEIVRFQVERRCTSQADSGAGVPVVMMSPALVARRLLTQGPDANENEQACGRAIQRMTTGGAEASGWRDRASATPVRAE